MKKCLLIVSVLFLSIVIGHEAIAQLSLTGEIRPRTEYNHGVKSLVTEDQKADLFTEQRTRLNFGFNADKKYKIGITLQDVRTWGSQRQLNKSDGILSIQQAWAEVFFTDKFSVKVGRQELVYDDHRILGNVAWAQQARSHDLALFKYEGNFKLHAGFAYNQDDVNANNTVYSVSPSYKAMQYLWFNKSTEKVNFSMLFLNNGVQGRDMILDEFQNVIGEDPKTNFSQTFGPRFVYKGEQFGFSTALYYQTGKVGTEAGQKINAHDIMLDVSYKISDKFKLIAGYERLSGTDSNNSSDKNKSFAPLYGTNHKFNGLMDYFYVGNHANNVGLQDIYLSGKLKSGKHTGGLDVHYFTTAADLNNLENTGTVDSGLGAEVDITWGYKFSNDVILKAGYSQLFATESMEVLKGGDKDEINNWGWVMLIVKPNFLPNKAKGK